jgi:hypothetical protein
MVRTKFDLELEIENMEINPMMKAMFKFKINQDNMIIKSKKELLEAYDSFKNTGVTV